MAKLQKLPLKDLGKYQNIALNRLTLLTMANVHELVGEFQTYLLKEVSKKVDSDGNADVTHILQNFGPVTERYKRMIDGFTKLLVAAQTQAASLPFAVLVAQHNHYLAGYRLTESEAADTGTIVKLWQKRRYDALEAARSRSQGDGLKLSTRIWKLDQNGLKDIRATLGNAYVNRTSALRLAKQLEDKLGANADMPRWTRQRLYGMTPTERMTDKTGLIQDPNARSKGIAYNAIRMARTELQYANHAMSTEIAAHAPWITGRDVVLSPAHPKSDICDKKVANNPYEKDDNILPLHPNCLCYYRDRLTSDNSFKVHINTWLDGDGTFLDDYSQWIGTKQLDYGIPWSISLADTMELWLNTNQGAQAAALKLPDTPEPVAVAPVVVKPNEPPKPRVGTGSELAPEFKTTKEAQAWAAKRFPTIKIDYGKLDPKIANEINQTLLDNLEKVPHLEKTLNFVGSAQARNKLLKEEHRADTEAYYRKAAPPSWTDKKINEEIEKALNRYVKKIAGNVYALAYREWKGSTTTHSRYNKFTGIVINEKFGSNYDTMAAAHANDVAKKWHPVGCESPKATIDHELGHSIDFLFGIEHSAEFSTILQQIKAMPGGIDDNLSRYAKTKNIEVISEAWSEYVNNPNPREPARLVGEHILDLVKRSPIK